MQAENLDVTIREFVPGDEIVFRRLNEDWILRYFVMESKDEETLGDPRGRILERGGRIFMADRQGEAVGCCALVPMGDGWYEVAKMAVAESCQRAGVGRRLLERVISEARAGGAKRLCLETNRQLTPAIRLYESVGFRYLSRAEASPYARSDVYMELSFD